LAQKRFNIKIQKKNKIPFPALFKNDIIRKSLKFK